MAGKKITGRTKQLSLKSTPEFHQRLKVLASKEKCLMIEILEQAIELYEKDRKERKKTAKENVVPKVPQSNTNKRKMVDDYPNQGTETGSKKRKISE